MADRLAELDLPEGRTWNDYEVLPGMSGDMPARPAARRWLSRIASAVRPRIAGRFTGDTAILAGGLALALVCALFPWYIFLNQEKFGIQPVEFEGSKFPARVGIGQISETIGARLPAAQRELAGLDAMATGTVEGHAPEAVPPSDQPFPGEAAQGFQLVFVANGRAMIEDGSGYWIVQRGARLPDGSDVASIERRDGGWALVTSRNDVMHLESR